MVSVTTFEVLNFLHIEVLKHLDSRVGIQQKTQNINVQIVCSIYSNDLPFHKIPIHC